jgi:hypothetical protein
MTLKRLDERLSTRLRTFITLISRATNYASNYCLAFLQTLLERMTHALGRSLLLLQFVACNIYQPTSIFKRYVKLLSCQFKCSTSFTLVCRETIETLRQPPQLGLIYIRLLLSKSEREGLARNHTLVKISPTGWPRKSPQLREIGYLVSLFAYGLCPEFNTGATHS